MSSSLGATTTGEDCGSPSGGSDWMVSDARERRTLGASAVAVSAACARGVVRLAMSIDLSRCFTLTLQTCRQTSRDEAAHPEQRDADPVRPIVELVRQLVQRLAEDEGAQQDPPVLVAAGQGRRPDRGAVAVEKRVAGPVLPRLRPRSEPRKIFRGGGRDGYERRLRCI